MTSAPQYVTLVTQGGTPVRLTNQLGAPYPTTGRGAIVFAEGPVIHNPTFIGGVINVSGEAIGLMPGTVTAPSIYFGDIESDDGFYSSGLHHVCITINGAQVADFSAAGLGVTGNITYTGTLSGPHAAFTGNVTAPTVPYPDNNTNVATTAYVTAALTAGLTGAYLPLSGGTVSGDFYVGSAIYMNPLDASVTATWFGMISAGEPGLSLENTNNPVDAKNWMAVIKDATGNFVMGPQNDAWVGTQTWTFARNGTTRFPNHIFTENAFGGVQLDPGGWIYVYSNNSDYAGMDFTRSDRPANDRLWVLNQGVSGDFRIAASDDAYGALKSWIFQRDGSTTLPGPLTGPAATFTDTTVVWSSLVATAPTWPGISWTSTAAPVNAKNWAMTVDAGAVDNTSLRLQVNDDSWTLLREWMFNRDGSTTLPGALKVTGTNLTAYQTIGYATRLVTIDGGQGAAASLQVTNVTGSNANISVHRYTASEAGPSFSFAHSKTNTIGGHAAVDDNDLLGILSFNGSDGDSYAEGAYISASVEGTVADGSVPSRLVFHVTPAGELGSYEAMRISSTRNISMQAGLSIVGALTGTSATFSGNVTAPNIVKITVGPTAPSSPSVNDIWIDTN